MPTPNLTSKELTALKEQLSGEQLLIKKYTAYSSMCADPQLGTCFQQIANKHQNHYDRLIQHLK